MFEATIRDRLPAWRRLATLICGDWDIAQDVVQVAALRLALAWDRIEPQGLESYGRQVVVRAAVDECRKRHRRVERLVPAPDRQSPVGDVDADLDVRQLLQGLPAQQRAVLVLRFLNDLSVVDTAAALQISQGTVKSHTVRGLRSLRGRMTAAASDVHPTTGAEVAT